MPHQLRFSLSLWHWGVPVLMKGPKEMRPRRRPTPPLPFQSHQLSLVSRHRRMASRQQSKSDPANSRDSVLERIEYYASGQFNREVNCSKMPAMEFGTVTTPQGCRGLKLDISAGPSTVCIAHTMKMANLPSRANTLTTTKQVRGSFDDSGKLIRKENPAEIDPWNALKASIDYLVNNQCRRFAPSLFS